MPLTVTELEVGDEVVDMSEKVNSTLRQMRQRCRISSADLQIPVMRCLDFLESS